MSGLDFPSLSVDQLMLSNLLTLEIDGVLYPKHVNSISKPLVLQITYVEESQRNWFPRRISLGVVGKVMLLVGIT